MLMQDKKPIAYFSKALSTNLNKSAYEKEWITLVLAVQHWRPYLLGRRFVVYSDQQSLRHLPQQCITTADQQNWIAKPLGYQFNVVYKPEPANKVVDSLLRLFKEGELKSVTSFPMWMQEQQVQQEVHHDPFLKKMIVRLQENLASHPGFSMIQGSLFFKDRLVISPKSSCIPILLKEFHASHMGGHSRCLRTYRRMVESLYWVGMKTMIQEFVKGCDVCQRQKYLTSSPWGCCNHY